MYRVKQVDGLFIAQKRQLPFGWFGVPVKGDYLWASNDNQKRFCSFETLQKAIERIQTYKLEINLPKIKTLIIKYYEEN
tara:strand:+ start:434 stop:670 length:237 start_codon:yes stop_codon:yes gene_type:complete